MVKVQDWLQLAKVKKLQYPGEDRYLQIFQNRVNNFFIFIYEIVFFFFVHCFLFLFIFYNILRNFFFNIFTIIFFYLWMTAVTTLLCQCICALVVNAWLSIAGALFKVVATGPLSTNGRKQGTRRSSLPYDSNIGLSSSPLVSPSRPGETIID